VALVVLAAVAVVLNAAAEHAIRLLPTLSPTTGSLSVYGAMPLATLLMLSLLVSIAIAVSFTISPTATLLEIAFLRLMPLPPTSKISIFVAHTRI
jgi:hypothetical protein